MKQVNKENLIATIEKFVAAGDMKPMLIWFHSNKDIDEARSVIQKLDGCARVQNHPLYGHEHFINNGKVEKIADHPELTRGFVYPGCYNERTRFILYHRYNEQLHANHITYIMSLAAETGKPSIYLVNDYSKDETPDFSSEAFLEYEFV